MSSAPKSAASLSLLVPIYIVPAEGDDFAAPSWDQGASDTAALFRAFQDLVAPRAARFLLGGRDLALEGALDDESLLQLLELSADADSGLPVIAARPAMSHFDWSGVVREVGHAMLGEHFLGTPEEAARVFTEAVREAACVATAGFSGVPVPVLTMEKTDDGVVASLLGIWLADERQLQEMRRRIPAESWHDSTRIGQSSCLLLDAADVEGRGVKEALVSAAMLAVVLGGGGASAADVKPASASVSKFASFFGGDSKRGEKLQVKTQKLVQDSPRIYRDVLEAPHSDMRVIVNIGGQRAYIVKDGRIAFDTPISSASVGHRTPRGTFTITEKVRSGKMSTIYKCPLPGWMRLGDTAVGMHQGELPGYPASHGCIRMPLESALFIFDQVKIGTPVEVVDSWSPAQAQPGLMAQAN